MKQQGGQASGHPFRKNFEADRLTLVFFPAELITSSFLHGSLQTLSKDQGYSRIKCSDEQQQHVEVSKISANLPWLAPNKSRVTKSQPQLFVLRTQTCHFYPSAVTSDCAILINPEKFCVAFPKGFVDGPMVFMCFHQHLAGWSKSQWLMYWNLDISCFATMESKRIADRPASFGQPGSAAKGATHLQQTQ